MSYRPLADVRKDFRVDWYRCPIDGPRLRELSSVAAICRAGIRPAVTWRCSC